MVRFSGGFLFAPVHARSLVFCRIVNGLLLVGSAVGLMLMVIYSVCVSLCPISVVVVFEFLPDMEALTVSAKRTEEVIV